MLSDCPPDSKRLLTAVWPGEYTRLAEYFRPLPTGFRRHFQSIVQVAPYSWQVFINFFLFLMTKFLFAAAALALSVAAPALAQDVKVKSDAEKTKTTAAGMTTKTKMAADGKMKVKGKDVSGNRMKAHTKPRKATTKVTKAGSTGTATPATGMSGAGSGMDASTASSAGVMVGGAMMTPDKDIVTNAIGSSEHTTLVAAVKAAGLVPTLQSTGPFTVFAPTNAAFDKLPAGTVSTLVQPANKAKLTTILTYHVVPGRLRAADLTNGQVLTTVEGEKLTVTKNGGTVMLTDAKGGMATVTTADVISSNGVTHVIDTVLMPTK